MVTSAIFLIVQRSERPVLTLQENAMIPWGVHVLPEFIHHIWGRLFYVLFSWLAEYIICAANAKLIIEKLTIDPLSLSEWIKLSPGTEAKKQKVAVHYTILWIWRLSIQMYEDKVVVYAI